MRICLQRPFCRTVAVLNPSLMLIFIQASDTGVIDKSSPLNE
jgi:hypothetical protein